VGVAVEQVHDGIVLPAYVVALREVDDDLPVLSQHVRAKLVGVTDDVGRRVVLGTEVSRHTGKGNRDEYGDPLGTRSSKRFVESFVH
jgi:hypothetical protein